MTMFQTYRSPDWPQGLSWIPWVACDRRRFALPPPCGCTTSSARLGTSHCSHATAISSNMLPTSAADLPTNRMSSMEARRFNRSPTSAMFRGPTLSSDPAKFGRRALQPLAFRKRRVSPIASSRTRSQSTGTSGPPCAPLSGQVCCVRASATLRNTSRVPSRPCECRWRPPLRHNS